MVHLEWLKMILPAAKLPIAYRKVRKSLYGDRHLQTKAEIYTRYLVEKPFIRMRHTVDVQKNHRWKSNIQTKRRIQSIHMYSKKRRK